MRIQQGEASEAFSAKISLRSPQKSFIFIIKKYCFWMKVSRKAFNLALKKASQSETREGKVNQVHSMAWLLAGIIFGFW